jgi:hypothetical protein
LRAPDFAQAQQVQISKLTDVAFGTIANFTTDQTNSQSVCAYSSATGGRYSVTASGSGSGGAFTLASGGSQLAYEVQWAATANQTTGVALTPGVALTGQTGNGLTATCFFGFVPTASLITILRASALSAASAGTYSGTLSLLIAPN